MGMVQSMDPEEVSPMIERVNEGSKWRRKPHRRLSWSRMGKKDRNGREMRVFWGVTTRNGRCMSGIRVDAGHLLGGKKTELFLEGVKETALVEGDGV